MNNCVLTVLPVRKANLQSVVLQTDTYPVDLQFGIRIKVFEIQFDLGRFVCDKYEQRPTKYNSYHSVNKMGNGSLLDCNKL